MPEKNSLIAQVDSYLKDFKARKFAEWNAETALYHMEFGINDINTAGTKYLGAEPAIFLQYESVFDRASLLVSIPQAARSAANLVPSCMKVARGIFWSLMSHL